MIQSMTGYGRVSRHAPFGTMTVELRSINHRYLEINPRLPEELNALEPEIGQLIRQHLRRGRVDVTMSIQGGRPLAKRVVLNEALVRQTVQQLAKLKARHRLKGDLTLAHVLMVPQIMSIEENARKDALDPAAARQALQAALRGLVAMRTREGARLLRDIRGLANGMARRLRAIQARLPKRFAQQQRRFRRQVKALLGAGSSAAPAQIQEAVSFLKDIDIHEELVRLNSHLHHVQQLIAGMEPVGKKLDFIAQELMREANTIGAKANDAFVARAVIAMKEAIEKIREQAQNLE